MVSSKFGDASELRPCWGWLAAIAGLSSEGRTPGRWCVDGPDHAYGLQSEVRMDNRDGRVRSCPIRSCPIRSCPIRSCPIRSCPIRSCPILSGPVRSGPVRNFYLILFVQVFDRRKIRQSQIQALHVAELFKEQSGHWTACWHVPA